MNDAYGSSFLVLGRIELQKSNMDAVDLSPARAPWIAPRSPKHKVPAQLPALTSPIGRSRNLDPRSAEPPSAICGSTTMSSTGISVGPAAPTLTMCDVVYGKMTAVQNPSSGFSPARSPAGQLMSWEQRFDSGAMKWKRLGRRRTTAHSQDGNVPARSAGDEAASPQQTPRPLPPPGHQPSSLLQSPQAEPRHETSPADDWPTPNVNESDGGPAPSSEGASTRRAAVEDEAHLADAPSPEGLASTSVCMPRARRAVHVLPDESSGAACMHGARRTLRGGSTSARGPAKGRDPHRVVPSPRAALPSTSLPLALPARTRPPLVHGPMGVGFVDGQGVLRYHRRRDYFADRMEGSDEAEDKDVIWPRSRGGNGALWP